MNIWVDASGWPLPPYLLVSCLVLEILYFRGWGMLLRGVQAKQRLKARTATRVGSGADAWQGNPWYWRGIFFPGALFALLIVSSAPVDNLAGRLLWVHMIQHLLLLGIIPPLLVAASPLLPLWLGLPRWARRLFKLGVRLKIRRAGYRLGGWLRWPVVSCVLFVAGIWIWHWPVLYDLALTNHALHEWGEHITFLLVSCLFWSQVIPSPPLHARLGYVGRVGCVGIAIAQNVVLAVVIGFSQVPLYAPYVHLVPGIGGLTALQDQQIGAGIMWTFGDLPFGIALSVLVHQWLTAHSDDTAVVLSRTQ